MSTVVFGALCASIIMSAGRNLLSKSISDFKFGTRSFFGVQAMIFFCGFVILIIPAIINNEGMSVLTVVYALIYALLMITAQWSYTAALGGGNTAICVTIYSLGFIFPTLSGSLFWNETFTAKNMLGLIAVIMAVIISGYQKDGGRIKAKYFLPLPGYRSYRGTQKTHIYISHRKKQNRSYDIPRIIHKNVGCSFEQYGLHFPQGLNPS